WEYFISIVLPFVRGERNITIEIDTSSTEKKSFPPGLREAVLREQSSSSRGSSSSSSYKTTTTGATSSSRISLSFDFRIPALFFLAAAFYSQRHYLKVDQQGALELAAKEQWAKQKGKKLTTEQLAW
ncbi:unnamed protein product, partial [Amoebophrya sp. A25]